MKQLTADWEYDACNRDRVALAGHLRESRKSRVFWDLCDRMEEYACAEMLREIDREDAQRKKEIIARKRQQFFLLKNTAFDLAEQAMKEAVRLNKNIAADQIETRKRIHYMQESFKAAYINGYIAKEYQPRESGSMLYVFPEE